LGLGIEALDQVGQRADPADDGGLDLPVVPAALKRQPTDLVALVTRFAEFLRPEALASDVQLEVLVEDPPPPAVSADGDQLRQALLNLSKNSLDALKHRHGERRLRLRVTGAPAGWVGLVVEDNGPGFPESMKEALFKPFVTDKPHGTGLGLAVTRDIVLAHGGEIAVEEAAPDGGARVRIMLPLA
ncbi:MAG TPA: HAMP domain-containing sensor histidine kinase, partial [Myxococcota bacterium]|nr:HAMP domain-containing sensor histidine kinase [Myxococcota bacterium]